MRNNTIYELNPAGGMNFNLASGFFANSAGQIQSCNGYHAYYIDASRETGLIYLHIGLTLLIIHVVSLNSNLRTQHPGCSHQDALFLDKFIDLFDETNEKSADCPNT